MKKYILIFSAIIAVTSPVYGMVYTWSDSAGVRHFTNKEHEIPASFRAKAKSLYPEQGDSIAQQKSVPSVPLSPPAPVQQAKPEVPALNNQPAVNAKSKNYRATRKGRRNREETEE